MKIRSSTFTLYFPQNFAIRESIFELEKILNDFQHPFTLVPLPQDAPADIPRIVAATENQHSQLLISANSAQLSTKYDNGYPDNIDKCIEYIRKRASQIRDALAKINKNQTNPDIYYSGLIMELEYGWDDKILNPVDFIMKQHFRGKVTLPVSEAGFREALILEDKYYVNIMLQSAPGYIGQPDERGSYAGLSKEDYLQVTLDINDRYAFNSKADYVSDDQVVSKIADLMRKFVVEYITHYVNTGELEYASE